MTERANLGHFLFLRRLCLGAGGHEVTLHKRTGDVIGMRVHAKMANVRAKDRSERLKDATLHEGSRNLIENEIWTSIFHL
jgi:hypothetical protein